MCFHSNQHPSSIKHPFISLYSKYQSFMFTCFPDMNSPVFPILTTSTVIIFKYALIGRGRSKLIKIPRGFFLMASVFMKRGKYRKEIKTA